MMTNKTRILFLEKYLMEQTDETHTVGIQELLDLFEKQGEKLNRDTVRSDLETLTDMGRDIRTRRKGKFLQFHMGRRALSFKEIRDLTDAVSCAQFLTAEKASMLKERLAGFASVYQRKNLQIQRIASVQSEMEDLPKHVEIIQDAIEKERKISFRYFEYNGYKQRVARHRNAVYTVSPYGMAQREDKLYVIGFSDTRQRIANYRVDRMDQVRLLPNQAEPYPAFDLNDYMRHMIKMYSGKDRTVELLCDDAMMKHILDKFGRDVETHKVSETRFIARVVAQISPLFFGWVFQYAGQIQIIAPSDVLAAYLDMLQTSLIRARDPM